MAVEEEKKKSVRMFQLYWDLEIELRIYLFVSQLKGEQGINYF